jgi:hypothetical protein
MPHAMAKAKSPISFNILLGDSYATQNISEKRTARIIKFPRSTAKIMPIQVIPVSEKSVFSKFPPFFLIKSIMNINENTTIRVNKNGVLADAIVRMSVSVE